MSEVTPKDEVTKSATAIQPTPIPGRPQEQLEVEDAAVTSEDDIVYPAGIKRTMAIVSLLVTAILTGIDLTIVAPVIPKLTDEFETLEDIGWYSSIYMVVLASFLFFCGKLFTLFSVKWLYVIGVVIFEIGSLLCTVAPDSHTFILGRGVAGFGSAFISIGGFVILGQCFPNHKRPFWNSIVGAAKTISLVTAPIIGGLLIDALNWRACFGINLPLGVIAVVLLVFGFQDLAVNPEINLPWREKLRAMDLLGTFFMVPSVTCLLMALQWGGLKFGWSDTRIIVLFVLFGVLFAGFGWRQYKLQEKATLPPRILKQRSVMACSWYNACANGALAVTEYYMTIYFQGVKGFSAGKSGVFILPMLIGLCVAGVIGGMGVSFIGYYTPFMFVSSIFASIAAGLLTTLNLDESLVKVLCYLGFFGFAMGMGLQTPSNAVQTILPSKDVPAGIAITGFGGCMGSALFVSASSTLFQNRLVAEVQQSSPGLNTTQLYNTGLSSIRSVVGADRLESVLLGYDKAVTQTLYLPLALASAMIIGAVFTEWRSVKQKQS